MSGLSFAEYHPSIAIALKYYGIQIANDPDGLTRSPKDQIDVHFRLRALAIGANFSLVSAIHLDV